MEFLMKIKLLVTVILGCYNAWGQADFSYQRALNGAKKGWGNLEITGEIYDHTQRGFKDLRFYTVTKKNDTLEIPYLIDRCADKSSRAEILFKLISIKKVQNEYYYVFRFDDSAKADEMVLNFKANSYDYKVAVDGSVNQQNWTPIVDDHRLIKVMNEYTKYEYNKIDLPAKSFQYYRLRIPSESKPMMILPKLYKNTIQEGELKECSLKGMDVTRDKTSKETIIDLDLTHNVPLDRLELKIEANEDYYRNMKILYLVDSVKVDEGYNRNYSELHRVVISSLEENVFEVPNVKAKQVRLVIEDLDNSPLNIAGVKLFGFINKVKLRIDYDGEHFARYGSINMEPPLYDLVHFKQKMPKKMLEINLGKEEMINEKEVEEALFENKIWLYAIMVVLVFVLGVFTLKIMRKSGSDSNSFNE
jgi:hypothetical protein